jgi:hypothetical protein
MTDPTLDFLRSHSLALTRENYLTIAYMGSPPDSTEELEIPQAVLAAERRATKRSDAKFLRSIGIKP